MHTSSGYLLVAAISIGFFHGAVARDIPQNLKTFYNNVKAAGTCKNILKGGLADTDDGPKTFCYCGDHLNDMGVMYIQGKNGQLAGMDIDCDGNQKGPGNDGRCDSSGDTQSTTAFADTVKGYKAGISELNAYVHPYVVFGNDNEDNKSGFVSFHPEDYGIKPLSVMAVVCGNKLIYGIWGDTNGADGSRSLVGESSLSLATACFGTGVNGDNGHETPDVLYIAFTGSHAVPGRSGAKWNAQSYSEFEASITGLGDQLVQGIQPSRKRDGARSE